jgi:hypothetical protein
MNTTLRQNNKGFGAIELLLILLVVVVLAGAGWYVWMRENKAKTPTTGNTSTTNKTSQNGTTPQSKPDPYAGWKTYADTQHHYTFKYPAAWSINTSSSEQVTLLNTSKSIEVDYLYVDPHTNGPTSFTAVSIDGLSDTTQALRVVGGLYGGVTPEYNVVDSTLLSTYPLTIGQSSQFLAYPHFTDTHVANGTKSGTLRAKSTNSDGQTSAWFSGADAKTSLLILRSFAYQQQ